MCHPKEIISLFPYPRMGKNEYKRTDDKQSNSSQPGQGLEEPVVYIGPIIGGKAYLLR